MGTLYVVSTPIGNLEDITLRGLRVLKEVGLIAAEDTRTTRKFLTHYGIKTPLTSYHRHNALAKAALLMETLDSQDVALVSDAGTPGISDPGYELVLQAIEARVPVVPVPGSSAALASLAVSGLPAGGFLFLGFLPRRKGERRRLLSSLRTQAHTLVIFEAPHRLRDSLEDILALLGDRGMAVCRELTKVYEEVFRGSVSEAIDHFAEPRGEFTLVLEGAAPEEAQRDLPWAKGELSRLKKQGAKAREAVDLVALTAGMSKKEVYRLWLEAGSTDGNG